MESKKLLPSVCRIVAIHIHTGNRSEGSWIPPTHLEELKKKIKYLNRSSNPMFYYLELEEYDPWATIEKNLPRWKSLHKEKFGSTLALLKRPYSPSDFKEKQSCSLILE